MADPSAPPIPWVSPKSALPPEEQEVLIWVKASRKVQFAFRETWGLRWRWMERYHAGWYDQDEVACWAAITVPESEL